MGRYGKGLHPNDPAKVAHRVGAYLHPNIAAVLAAGPIPDWDLTGKLSSPFDQGASSTCFAHSLAAGIYCVLGPSLLWVPSPELIAQVTYADMRGTGPGPLIDGGAQLQDVSNSVGHWGIAPIGALVQGRYSDVANDVPGLSFPEIDGSRLITARSKIITGEYTISVSSPDLDLLDAAGVAGYPTWIGGPVGPNYENLNPNQVAQPEPSGDGHAQLVVARRTVNGNKVWIVRNSWGLGWCLNGNAQVSADWLLSMWNWWPLTVSVAA